MRYRSLTLALALLAGADARAETTKNTENSAVATGMANAQVAISHEPAANFYNPAALTTLAHSALEVGVSALDLEGTFEAGRDVPPGAAAPELRAGRRADQVLAFAPPPYLYGAWRIPDPALAVGLGVYAPFASGSQFAAEWAGRSYGVKSLVLAYAVNPNVAYEIRPGLSVALGGSFVQSSLEIRQVIQPILGDPANDIGVHIAADGHGYQGNAAVLWQPHKKLALGASYRTAVKVPMAGAVDFDVPNAVFAGALPDQDVKTTFRFPDTLNVGVGLFPSPRLKLDLEGEFVRFNVNKVDRIELATGRPEAALVTRNDWVNTVTLRAGAEARGSERWLFRGGLAWIPTPVPDNRVNPLTPDADRVAFALGTTYTWRANAISLGVQLQHFLNRSVTAADIAAGAPDLPGTYRSNLYIGGLSWTYAFGGTRTASAF
jgi:long-chain fatty acid transport protein